METWACFWPVITWKSPAIWLPMDVKKSARAWSARCKHEYRSMSHASALTLHIESLRGYCALLLALDPSMEAIEQHRGKSCCVTQAGAHPMA